MSQEADGCGGGNKRGINISKRLSRQREKNDQKDTLQSAIFSGLFNTTSTVQSHIGEQGEKKYQ